MKKALILLTIFIISACGESDRTLDTDSPESFKTSFRSITETMTKSEKEEFAESIMMIYESRQDSWEVAQASIIRSNRLQGLMQAKDIVKEGFSDRLAKDVINASSELLDGRTAKEVNATANEMFEESQKRVIQKNIKLSKKQIEQIEIQSRHLDTEIAKLQSQVDNYHMSLELGQKLIPQILITSSDWSVELIDDRIHLTASYSVQNNSTEILEKVAIAGSGKLKSAEFGKTTQRAPLDIGEGYLLPGESAQSTITVRLFNFDQIEKSLEIDDYELDLAVIAVATKGGDVLTLPPDPSGSIFQLAQLNKVEEAIKQLGAQRETLQLQKEQAEKTIEQMETNPDFYTPGCFQVNTYINSGSPQ